MEAIISEYEDRGGFYYERLSDGSYNKVYYKKFEEFLKALQSGRAILDEPKTRFPEGSEL